MNQADLLLEYFSAGGSLTVAEALTKFGIYALSQRVGELKRDGVPIESEPCKLPSGKTVSRYRMGGIAHG